MKLAFDIGANIGQKTNILLNSGYKVVAFEPNPDLNNKLNRIYKDNDNIIIDSSGLSDNNGINDFFICNSETLSTLSLDFIKNSRFSNKHNWNVKIPINTITLDSAIEKYGIPDFIKIDVEGYELNVIKGLTKLLSNTMICFEWEEENKENIEAIVKYLQDIGYNNFSIKEKDDIYFENELTWLSWNDINFDFDVNRKEKWGMIYVRKDQLITTNKNILDETYASYINLDVRKDRDNRMVSELKRIGLSAIRFKGLLPNEVGQPLVKIKTMLNRTPGAIGCHFSQVGVMKKALEQNKHALVMEDDLIFCDDFMDRLNDIQNFLNTHEWDVFWLGGTYHIPAEWHKIGHHPDMQKCSCKKGTDVEKTDVDYIVRTYGCWSTYAYIVNKKSLPRILDLLDTHVHMSMGIDWLFMKLSPDLYTYAYVPGCVKQYDNPSNIGQGITEFSGFSRLGDYWFQSTKNNFDYISYHNKLNK
jgi:FkbM family methyltransferase